MKAVAEQELAGRPADEAIPKLIEAYGGRLYAIGLRLCESEETAEDLVQETFVRAWRGWEGFEGRSQPSTWLYTIAARTCRRMRRRRVGEPRRVASLAELLPSAEEAIEDAGTLDPLDEAIRREARESVIEAIARLPLHFRLPLVLKELAGLSLGEIAAVLGIREATVKTRVHRGRLLLRRAVAERLPSHPAPPPDHERQVCLDLLRAKQEALDRGVPFPVPASELCSRCHALFRTLDLGHGVCAELGDAGLPPRLRALLLDATRRAE